MWVKRCFLKAYLTISQPAVKGNPATVRNIGELLQREKRNKPLLSVWSESAHVGNPLSPTLHLGGTPCTMWLSPAARWWHRHDLVLVSCCGTHLYALRLLPRCPRQSLHCTRKHRGASRPAAILHLCTVVQSPRGQVGCECRDDKEEPKMQRLMCQNYK